MLQFMAYGFQKTFGERDGYHIGGDEFVALTVDLGADERSQKDAAMLLKEQTRAPAFIKVTESLVSKDTEELEALLEKLREDGFKIEMDDFGKGYSSLNTLGTLPLDIVKLDMSFISQIQNERKLRILTAMINLAKSLQLGTIAEGVETKEQLKILQELGCDAIQGYYFSKPLPKEQFLKYLSEKSIDR